MKNKYLKGVIRHFLIWTPAFSFFTIMRQYGQEVVQPFEPLSFLEQVRFHLVLGFIAGIIFGTIEYLFERYVLKKFSLGKTVLFGTISYLAATILLINFGVGIFAKVIGMEFNWEFYSEFLESGQMWLIIFYTFVIGFFIDFFRQVDKKFGPGNLWKMIKGEFYQPKEDEKIFMFLDLKSSTAIAEQLGHMKYSKFIQDCFIDLEVVEKYNAAVYQYVGDEAVLTWDKHVGLINSNCLRAFFAFEERLKLRSKYYMEQYNVVPEFKAGLNMGKIVIAEVGEIKTEIAYHGDTINTAARIQEQCNPLGKTLLVSELLRENLDLSDGFSSLLVGDILLKGKKSKINIYSVEAS